MVNKVDLDQDLAIFYSGGSGGFLFYYILMLFKKHIVGYDIETLKKFKTELPNIEISSKEIVDEKIYSDLKGSDWPSYHNYIENNFTVDNEIKQEIKNLKHKFTKQIDYSVSDKNYDLLIDNLDLLIKAQWQGTKRKWTDLNIIPDNDITRDIQSEKYKHKLYFYRSGNVNGWKNYTGKKLIFYTDFKTQLRMSIYKKAKWFDDYTIGKKEISISDVKSVINNIEVVDGINKEVYDLMPYADYAVTLQDLINRTDQIFLENINNEQRNLIDHYRSLHPESLLKKTNLYTNG